MTTRYNLLHSVASEQRRTLNLSVTEVQSAIYYLCIKGTTEDIRLAAFIAHTDAGSRDQAPTSLSRREAFLHRQCISYLAPSNCSRAHQITPEAYPSTWMMK